MRMQVKEDVQRLFRRVELLTLEGSPFLPANKGISTPTETDREATLWRQALDVARGMLMMIPAFPEWVPGQMADPWVNDSFWSDLTMDG